jgi:thioredoxin 1
LSPLRIVGPVVLEHVSEAGFARKVLAGALPVLVDFTAEWCPPCQLIAPVLQAISDEEAHRLRVVSVDVDENAVVADLYQVTAMPTLVLFSGGREVTRISGVKPRELILAELASSLRW